MRPPMSRATLFDTPPSALEWPEVSEDPSNGAVRRGDVSVDPSGVHNEDLGPPLECFKVDPRKIFAAPIAPNRSTRPTRHPPVVAHPIARYLQSIDRSFDR